MPDYTDADRVRTHFQFHQTGDDADGLVSEAIAAAEAVLSPQLSAALPPPPGPDDLQFAATLLAGAILLRSLATAEAHEGALLTLGGQRLDSTRRFGQLMARAADAEASAWRLAAPNLAPSPVRKIVAALPTMPIFSSGADGETQHHG